MLKYLLSCAFILAMGCIPPSSPQRGSAVQEIKSKTVALVEESDEREGGVRPYCTGVWVSDRAVLTANHCVRGLDLGDIVGVVVESDVFPAGSLRIRDAVDIRQSLLTSRDEDHDLALLKVVIRPPSHGIAQVSEDVNPGDEVQQVGHSVGLWWSFSRGDVAAIRMLNSTGTDMLFVQTTTPTSPGNSGGGLYNDKGELVGLCHGGFTRGQLLNVFVHPAYINIFLRGKL